MMVLWPVVPASCSSPTCSSCNPPPSTQTPPPLTLDPGPWTLRPTPCTLHPAPCTLHPTPQNMLGGERTSKMMVLWPAVPRAALLVLITKSKAVARLT
jgi:hypothetical protein